MNLLQAELLCSKACNGRIYLTSRVRRGMWRYLERGWANTRAPELGNLPNNEMQIKRVEGHEGAHK